jgi:ketosteroid isomerase-like protein
METAATENKMLVKRMLAGEVDWLEQWASNQEWMISGSARRSGTCSGNAAIGRNLLASLTAEMESLGRFKIDNVVAEGNYVVV